MRSARRRTNEHVNHERWLVSYADFVTLLFALFVVLFASSHHEQQAIRKVSRAVKSGLQDLGATHHALGSTSTIFADPEIRGAGVDAKTLPSDMRVLEAKLRNALEPEIRKQQVVLNATPDGVVISLHEFGFFDSGQAKLLPDAASTIKRISDILMLSDLDMRVEGHSDNVPIHNNLFNSNWELSTGRATAVAMMLLKKPGFEAKRLSISGYAEYRPVATNETPEGRRNNRRVDLVIIFPHAKE